MIDDDGLLPESINLQIDDLELIQSLAEGDLGIVKLSDIQFTMNFIRDNMPDVLDEDTRRRLIFDVVTIGQDSVDEPEIELDNEQVFDIQDDENDTENN